MKKKIFVTGATGFIGCSLCDALIMSNYEVLKMTRSEQNTDESVLISDLVKYNNWNELLKGVDVVVHLAGRAHVLNDKSLNPLDEFRYVNTQATIKLAEGAAGAGVKRIVFISSIGVNGISTSLNPFKASDMPEPQSYYAQSKYEAELALHEISKSTGIEIVIIRPPLVYGPNAPGNFLRLMKLLNSRLPVPLGLVSNNRRSFVSVLNLVDLIQVCLDHPAAANCTFLISDGEDISTTDLIKRLCSALNIHPILLPIPPFFLLNFARLLGKNDLAQRLLGDLRIDIQYTCDTLKWYPAHSLDQGLKITANAFHKTHTS